MASAFWLQSVYSIFIPNFLPHEPDDPFILTAHIMPAHYGRRLAILPSEWFPAEFGVFFPQTFPGCLTFSGFATMLSTECFRQQRLLQFRP